MKTIPISLQEFIDSFEILSGKILWRVIHPAGGMLFWDLGKQYVDSIPAKSGEEVPYNKGELQVSIYGEWEIFFDGSSYETKIVQGDDQRAYFNRMQRLEDNFPIRTIESVNYVNNSLVITGDSAEIRIPVSGEKSEVSLTRVKLSRDNMPIHYEHFRFDDEMKSLVHVC